MAEGTTRKVLVLESVTQGAFTRTWSIRLSSMEVPEGATLQEFRTISPCTDATAGPLLRALEAFQEAEAKAKKNLDAGVYQLGKDGPSVKQPSTTP